MMTPKIGRCRECLSTLVLEGTTMVAALPYPNLPPSSTAPANPLSVDLERLHRAAREFVQIYDADCRGNYKQRFDAKLKALRVALAALPTLPPHHEP